MRPWRSGLRGLAAPQPVNGGGNGREQGARIGVARCREQARGRRQFDDLAQIHHRHTVGDVSDDAQIQRLFDDLGQAWPQFDGFVHSIGFAPREAIAGDFLDGLSREAFRIAHDISSYSFPAMAKAALPRLTPTAALLTLTYLGSVRSVPNYNTMGLAKASLEASVRYLASSLGPKGIRVNGISAGPIKTLAASGIKDFGKLLGEFAANAPLRRNVTIDDVGNVAAFLMSDLAAGVTSEITYVDAGFSHAMGGVGSEG